MHNNKNNIWGEIFSRSKIDFIYSDVLDLSAISFAHNTFVGLYYYSPELKIIPYLIQKNLENKNKKYLICLSSSFLLSNKQKYFIEPFIEPFIKSLAFYLKTSTQQIILAFKSNHKQNNNSNNINLMDYINNNNLEILNLSADIKFIEEKFINPDYANIRTLDISSVLSNPLLKKQVLRDVLPLSD